MPVKKSSVPKEVQALMKDITKKWKTSKVHNFAADPIEFEVTATGRPTIDFVTNGGFKRGSISLIGGVRSSGKTMLAFQGGKKIIDLDPKYRIAYVDSEHSVDNNHLINMGIDPGKVERYDFETLEDAIDAMTQAIMPSGLYPVIIWDSPYNMMSVEQSGKTAKDRSRANMALILSVEAKRLSRAANITNTSLIICAHVSQNQERLTKYDPRFYIAGGERLMHNCDLILMMFPLVKAKGDKNEWGYDSIIGRKVKIVCEKCKYGPDWKVGTLIRLHEGGFDITEDVFYTGSKFGIIEGERTRMYGDLKLGGSRDKAVAFMKANPDTTEDIRKAIDQHYIDNEMVYTTDINASFITDEDLEESKKEDDE